jgi:hypothetical protein
MYNYILLREFLKNKKTDEEVVILSPDENVNVEVNLKIEDLLEPEIELEQNSKESSVTEIISLPVEVVKLENEQTKKSSIKKIKILNGSETVTE